MSKIPLIILTIILFTIGGCTSFKSVDSFGSNHTNDDFVKSVWIYRAAGIQCEITYYEDVFSAVDHLSSNDIEVMDSDDVNVIANAACGYPTSLRFIARIKLSDLEKARKLGWTLVTDKRYLYGFVE